MQYSFERKIYPYVVQIIIYSKESNCIMKSTGGLELWIKFYLHVLSKTKWNFLNLVFENHDIHSPHWSILENHSYTMLCSLWIYKLNFKLIWKPDYTSK